jgi:hypothetical protein
LFCFLKIGAVLVGGGYLLLPVLRADLVVKLHWLSESQLLDAMARARRCGVRNLPALDGLGLRRKYHGTKTIFPCAPGARMSTCAFAASLSGNSFPTIGRKVPFSSPAPTAA